MIFDKNNTVLPYTYPHLVEYADAIHSSFWIPEHFNYDADIRDFKTELTSQEQEIVKRCVLAIALVENKVKTFWARIDIRMPRTEVAIVGHTFAGNEVIHQLTYQKLLELLGLQDEFDKLTDVPCMEGRVKYLTKYLKGINSRSNKEFTKSLILFTLLIENASLFSQFLVMSSFYKYKNKLSNFNTIISATAREELVHGMFGAELINIIRKEYPEWFDEEMEDKIRRAIRKAYKAEAEVLDWIFENGELDFLPKESIKEYLKTRFNSSLEQIGYEQEYEVNTELLESTDFFDTSLTATGGFDFFFQKNTDYAADKNYDDLWN